ncbi:PGPGW domain-containing protein [Pelagicoccus sp. NFK12]|uniref:PGPGW domain-containing protein n=1 Tax=Pelagicoccus enzymogenes TaxID=2773457 RepID=A0A927F779_9BACT|nr:PGPGW domain-containing protein [Pelagicoccus enzymogenes]MBD5779747.1 PGPGW domain-containing protein [Pelagicoccus enzymogenes]
MKEGLQSLWEGLFQAVEREPQWMIWAAVASVLTFVGSLVAVPIVVVKMDADFFVRVGTGARRLTPIRAVRRICKNLLGWILLLAGIAMLVLPGQGLLTIALGVGLVDFPGKRRLQARIVRIEKVYRSINWIRKKAGKPPLKVPE